MRLKHAALLKKHEVLLAQARAMVNEHNAQAAFAIAAIRSPVTGHVFLRGSTIVARNPRFMEMERDHHGAWRGPRGLVAQTLAEFVRRLSAGLKRVAEATRIERTDGSCVMDVRVERIGKGPAPLVAAAVLDVTDVVSASRTAEAARQSALDHQRIHALGEVASGFAHDFNNMLHALKMWVAVLGTGHGRASFSDDERRAIEAIERILGDAAVRVGQIQDSARARGDVPLESLDIGQIVQQAVELARAQLVERSHLSSAPIEIASAFGSGLPRVRGAGSELRSVFLNLLLNARDAMPRGGTIHIDAGLQGESVVVTIADEGTGISEKDLDRIFDPFFTTKSGRGTGLGLSIARNVMRRLGGGVSAANRPQGRGAVFTLTFPVADERVPAVAAPAARSGVRAGRRRVLVIDDEPDNLEALETVMRCGGHEVATAANGTEAIARVERGERYDLVFCDLGMPDMNGWEVAERLRARAPGVAVYMITGWAHEISDGDSRRASVAGVLAKPLDLEELYRIVTGG